MISSNIMYDEEMKTQKYCYVRTENSESYPSFNKQNIYNCIKNQIN